ncbi:helix-turn-helix transcriptional regulator [Mycobacterium lepromatosis]|nr:helix-turn-helix transcriptional regulator [Mycobacterium lepromatosis]
MDTGHTDVNISHPADHHDDRSAVAKLKGFKRLTVTELRVLQAVRLKRRVSSTDLAATLDDNLVEITKTIEQLTAAGLLVAGTTLRITPTGRARLNALLDAERKGIDATELATSYHAFHSFNLDFKALATEWQLKEGNLNTHDNPEYDAEILARLDTVHERVVPIIELAATQLPRLSAYLTKLHTALNKAKAGEVAWFTKPLIDSYHTVWFELHEELILAVDLTREEATRSSCAIASVTIHPTQLEELARCTGAHLHHMDADYEDIVGATNPASRPSTRQRRTSASKWLPQTQQDHGASSYALLESDGNDADQVLKAGNAFRVAAIEV